MVVSEGAINNIMGGMENTAGVRLHSHRHKLKQRFDIIRKLGQGTYGKVQLAVNKETGQEVAIKTIKKAKIETEQDLIRIRREIQIMSSVQHPQIIHIYEVFENREKMVLVMEYAAGGELYDYLSERKVLSEDEARRVFRHVASATYYCHKHKICHRDLKLENILLDLDGNAKIADFGLSNVFDEKHRLDTFCGSPLYASPEIVKGIPYTGPEVDCWSLGVLLYTLVYGAMPFDGSNFKRLVKQITQGDYYEPKKPSRASELIRHMLTVSASKRATVEEICSHWWVNEGFSEPCLEVAEALANQTPVRLDLLLSLAPKHINSEHMLIQPEEDDPVVRSPPDSEATRPPPNLKLPPPPPSETPTPQQVTPARSASLGALTSVNSNEIEALVAQKLQQRKEEADEEEEEERKRKAADETGTVDRRKKKRDASDVSLKSARKEQKRMDEASVRRHPTSPDGESAERKKTLRQKEAVEAEEKEKAERRKSGEKKKRESVLVDGEVNDVSEREKRRSMRKVEKEKAEGEKMERKKSVKKRESRVERDGSASEGGERTERKKSVKKRDSAATSESSVDRNAGRKKDTYGDDLSGKDDSEFTSSSVINGEAGGEEEEEDEEEVRRESGVRKGDANKEPPIPRGSVEGKVRSENVHESPMEVEEDVKKSPSRSRSGESGRSTEGTLKASGSSISRETVSPVKHSGGVVPSPTSTTTAAPPPQESPRQKSPAAAAAVTAASQPPKVSDARKAFEAKPAEKPIIVLRKKSTAENLPSSLTPAKDTPTAPRESATGRSPAKDKLSPAKDSPKEIEKPREKSPRLGKETPNRVGSRVKMEAEAEKKAEESAKKEKPEVTKKTPPVPGAATEKPSKMEERTVASRPSEASCKPTAKEGKEEAQAKVEKSSKPEPKQLLRHRESSESSESESEAEQLLKILSEKREKVEAAKQEKLRKVSATKEPQADMAAINEEPQSKSPSKVSPNKSPSKVSPSKSPEKTAPASDSRETAPEQKFATLPRGFKTKGAQPTTSPVAATTPLPLPTDHPKKDRSAINQEIEGMMSAIKAVDQAITKGPSEGTQKTSEAPDTDRKKTKLEIILNSKQQQQPEEGAKRASYAEIKLSSPSTKEPSRTGFRSEVTAKVGAVPVEPVTGPKSGPRPGPGEALLQRAKRERIIPIMLEDDDEDDDTTASESHFPLDNSRRFGPSMSSGSALITSMPSQLPNSRPSDPRTPPVCTPTLEPIRKSRRERIIPIAVEGEGLMTPPPNMEEGTGLGATRAHQAFSRTLSSRPNTLSRGRGGGFLLDHSESFSSAGEEEEEDEDDGFQILTAESLFSTLLNRVRSLTRKMNAEDGRGDRVRRTSNRPTPEPGGPPGMPGAMHSGSAGFWSSLYNSPRDSPARRISETMSRSSLGRDEDGLGGLSSPLWTRSVSRDPSDADTLFSEPSSASQFGTLPRVRALRHSLHLPPPRLHPDPFFLTDFS